VPEKLFGFEIEIKKGVYFPREDTEFALAAIQQWAETFKINGDITRKKRIKILDMGSGTGILGISLYTNLKSYVSEIEVIFVDIFENALESSKINAEKYIPSDSYKIIRSDLFSADYFKNSMEFDVILFNAPYSPSIDEEIDDVAKIEPSDLCWYGGKEGYETTVAFLEQLANFCQEGSVLFLTSSSQTEQSPIIQTLKKSGFEISEKKELKLFFETIIEYVCIFHAK
jgi:HemK-like putative methylase